MSLEDDLKRCVSYDPATGIMTLKDLPRKRSPRKMLGQRLGYKVDGYLCARFDNRHIALHRIAWFLHYGEWPASSLDHINGDPFDNRICNLRLCSPQQNSFNRGPRVDNKSGYRGVSWDKTKGKWTAQLKVGMKNHHLGRYATPEEASAAVEAFAMKVHGDFYRPMT